MTASLPKKLLSIVIPVFNEEGNVLPAYRAALEALAPVLDRYDLEFVFTDNHSTDRTFELLAGLAAADARVRAFRFSKNCGYQQSICFGYRQARGAAAVQLDCDLEDPPALILDFLRHWEEGCKVVYGIRKKRRESWLRSAWRRLFYWIIDAISQDHLPQGAGDFRLIDRRILDELAKIEDPDIYIRGRIAVMGFRQLGIPYERQARLSGKSKFRPLTMINLALDGITSHSTLPLRLTAYFGFTCTALSLVLIIAYAVGRIFFGLEWPPGFATLVILLLFTTGANSCFLGILGEYLAKVHSMLKQPALPVVEETLGA